MLKQAATQSESDLRLGRASRDTALHLLVACLPVLACAFLPCAPLAPSPAAAADPDLLLQLKLDEGSGTAAADASGFGHDGTVVSGAGGPHWTTGKSGQALEFYNYNGTRTRYVRVPWQPTLQATTGLTLMGWVRVRTVTTGNQTVLGRGNSDTDWLLQLRNRARRLTFVLASGSAVRTLNVNLAANTLAAGDWHHIAATYDGSRMRIYLDGVLRGNRAASGQVVSASNPNLPVGAGAQPQTPTRWRNGIPGALDDVRLYKRALTAVEIQAAMNEAGPAITRLRWQENF